MKIICAFSSDSREQYKADIFRVLALPKGYTIHFRYNKRYVSQFLEQQQDELKGRSVCIFYTTGNTLTTQTTALQNHPIRLATIANAYTDRATDVFHVFMKLEDFCSIKITDTISTTQPPNNFFSELECSDTTLSTWSERINAVKEHFPDVNRFFHINYIKDRYGEEIHPEYSPHNNNSHFTIGHLDNYYICISTANTKNNGTTSISCNAAEITINGSETLNSNVPLDNASISLYAGQIQTQTKHCELSLIYDNSKPEYNISVGIKLTTTRAHRIILNALTTIATLSLASLSALSSYIAKGKLLESALDSNTAIILIIVASIIFGYCTTELFIRFNKK